MVKLYSDIIDVHSILKRGIRRGILGVFIGAVLSGTAFAQENSRESLTSPEMVRALIDDKNYNFRIGPVKLQVDASIQEEFNDNINLKGGKDQLSDFITRPGVQFLGKWQITELNQLEMTLGMSYAKYFSHPDLDSQNIMLAPNSKVDFTLYVGDFRIYLYDRFSMLEDPVAAGQLSGVTTFRRFENTMGTNVDWDLNQFILSAGLQYGTFLSMDPKFDSLQHDTYTAMFAPKYLINEAITVGLNNAYTITQYDQKVQNDTTDMRTGPFIEASLTKFTTGRLEVGYQTFEADSTGTINDSSNSSSWYSTARISNHLNKYFKHDLSLSRSAESSIGSNFIDKYSVDYGMDWLLVYDTGLRSSFFYEHFVNSGTTKETSDRYGMANRLSHPLTISTSIALEHRVTYKDSSNNSNDYLQNITSAIVSYHF